jgi:tetrahydromethanopterin S-methyltransferase subunit G
MNDLQELKILLTDFKEEINSNIENKIQFIDYKLDTINTNFNKLEKKNQEIEKEVKNLQLSETKHVLNCPQTPKLKDIQSEIDLLKKENDRQNSIKKFMNRLLIISGSVIGLIFSFIKLFEFISGK